MATVRVLLATIGAFVLLAPGGAEAGAFTLRPGEGKLFVAGYGMTGEEYFDRKGKRMGRGLYDKRELQAYGEYGVADGLTAFGATSFQKIKARDVEEHGHKGLGRSEFGARLRLIEREGWIVSAQLSGLVAGAKKSDGLSAIGETDDGVDVRGLVAKTFELFGKPAFLDLAAGHRWRSGDPADEVRLDATLGVRPKARLLLLAQSFNQLGTARWKGRYELKQRIHKLQWTTIYDLSARLSLVSAAFVTPAGRDALVERGATLGVGVRF
jgi:protein XagA